MVKRTNRRSYDRKNANVNLDSISPWEHVENLGVVTLVSFSVLVIFLGVAFGVHRYAIYFLILMILMLLGLDLVHESKHPFRIIGVILILGIALMIATYLYSIFTIVLITAICLTGITYTLTHLVNGNNLKINNGIKSNLNSHLRNNLPPTIHLFNWILFLVYFASVLSLLLLILVQVIDSLRIEAKLSPAFLLLVGIIMIIISLTVAFYITFEGTRRALKVNGNARDSMGIRDIRDSLLFGSLAGIIIGVIVIISLLGRV